MEPDDVPLALLRHATSKLREEAQLSAISTLGFRGEALPAIASVSQFTLTSRTRGAAAGTRIAVKGGGAPELSEVGAPEGTRVTVADLFFNTPARRKFLKQAKTEGAHCAELVSRLMLSRAEVGFALVSDGKRLMSVAPGLPLRERVALALGRELFEGLVAVEAARGGIGISGFAGSPDLSAATSQKTLLFVNGRAVRDRSLAHAVTRAYANLLPPGRYPVAVLFVDLPLDRVDINVHPQKSEVRFAEPRAVYEALAGAVTAALRPAPWLPASPDRLPTRFDGKAWAVSALVGEGAVPSSLGPSSDRILGLYPSRADRGPPPAFLSPPPTFDGAPLPANLFGRRGYFASLRYLGQLARTYLVCEGAAGSLVVLDQHAAHERVLFEQLRTARAQRGLSAQRLLLPAVVELGVSEAAALAAHRDELIGLGFELEPFGGQSWSVSAMPALLAKVSPASLLSDLAEQFEQIGSARAASDAESDVLATMACHAAVRAHDPLSTELVASLLSSLDAIDFKVRCPHGRPVVTELTLGELERRVDRR